jgi:hypothetical protein
MRDTGCILCSDEIPRRIISMKQIIWILVLTVAMVFQSDAQVIRSFGIKGGFVNATQSFDYASGLELPIGIRRGAEIGGFVEFCSLPVFSLLTELHYTQKGFQELIIETSPAYPEGNGSYVTWRPKLTYVSIPLLAKLRYDTPVITPYVIAGPWFEYLLSTDDTALKFRGPDYGITMGGGIELSVPQFPHLLVEGRYSPGVAKIFDNTTLNVKNSSTEILFGLAF